MFTMRTNTKGRPKALARWVSLFFGLGLLAGVVMFATHYSQEMAFAKLMLHARPAWLLVALVLQMGTYMTDARIWQRVLRRAHISRPLRSYVGLGLAKLFMDQAIPSVGLSGTLLVIRALDRRGVPRGASTGLPTPTTAPLASVPHCDSCTTTLEPATKNTWLGENVSVAFFAASPLDVLPACVESPL